MLSFLRTGLMAAILATLALRSDSLLYDDKMNGMTAEDLRLYQMEAEWSGAVSNAKDAAELTWSVFPLSTVRLNETGIWQDVPETSIQISLPRAMTIIAQYSMVAIATKANHPGGDFINDGQRQSSVVADFLGARLKIDNIP